MRTSDNPELHNLAERLAQEFDTPPVTTVITALNDCMDAWPSAGTAFIEIAARARLAGQAQHPQQQDPPRGSPV
jgi:hypothetical protein